MALHVSRHPLAGHLMSVLRDRDTQPHAFRTATKTLATLLAIEATTRLKLRPGTVETPLERAEVARISSSLVVVPVLRAGLSMLDPFLDLFPDVSVGYVGLVRNEKTAVASSYYCKLPELAGKAAFVLDPMLATGGSASQAVHLCKASDPDTVTLVSIVSAPEGVERIKNEHPDVNVYTAALDRELNRDKFILPGVGDYGDRLYGTEF